MVARGLTPTEQRVLDFLVKHAAANEGRSPSARQIATHMGGITINAVHCHLRNLANKNKITRHPGRARGLRVL